MTTFGLNRIVALAAVVAVVGCTKDQSATTGDTGLGPTRVATINGQPLPESVFRYYTLSTLQKNADELTPEQRTAAIEELVGFTLLAETARTSGLLDSRIVAAQLELNRLQMIARIAANDYLEKNPVTEDDIKTVYDNNLPRLSSNEYKARHILVETETEANAVIEQLRKGKDFVALAKEHASGPTGPNGGDLGWFTANSMIAPIVEAASTMGVGTYSAQPVKSDAGYHVLLLEGSRPQTPPTLDSMRPEITNAIQRNKLQVHLKTLREVAMVALVGDATQTQ
jgi:peptidyl-prolyl cis-trans isomerase C